MRKNISKSMNYPEREDCVCVFHDFYFINKCIINEYRNSRRQIDNGM